MVNRAAPHQRENMSEKLKKLITQLAEIVGVNNAMALLGPAADKAPSAAAPNQTLASEPPSTR